MAFCNKCGSELRAGSAFCSKCGTPSHKINSYNSSQHQQISNPDLRKTNSSSWRRAIVFCALLVFVAGSLMVLTLLRYPPKKTTHETTLKDNSKEIDLPRKPNTFTQFQNRANYPKTWDPLVVCNSIMTLEATPMPSGGDAYTDHYVIGEVVSMELEDNSTMSITWLDRDSNLASFITFRVPYNSKERNAISDLVLNQTGIGVDYDILYSVPVGSKRFVRNGEYDLVYRNHAEKGPAIMVVRNYRGNR